MLTLDFALSPAWSSSSGPIALEDAQEWVLRYDCFLGDVVFIVHEMDLSTRWGWVPVLDFALALDAIVDGLAREGAEEVFDFTESDATIVFRRSGDAVEVEASYVPGVAVLYEDLRVAVRRFLRRVLEELTSEHPELRENPFIDRVFGTIG